jgi:hypothetical protein
MKCTRSSLQGIGGESSVDSCCTIVFYASGFHAVSLCVLTRIVTAAGYTSWDTTRRSKLHEACHDHTKHGAWCRRSSANARLHNSQRSASVKPQSSRLKHLGNTRDLQHSLPNSTSHTIIQTLNSVSPRCIQHHSSRLWQLL